MTQTSPSTDHLQRPHLLLIEDDRDVRRVLCDELSLEGFHIHAEASGQQQALAPCDMARLTMDAVRDLVPLALDKHIDLGYEGAQPGEPGVQVNGNATLLAELVRNLLGNAMNYTPSSSEQPGVVTARVLADPFGHVLLVQVEDSGPGVAPAERELIFHPFYRTLGTGADGSGLGLPIVLEIARQHGAEVSVDDAHPGQVPPGACFSVRFPALMAKQQLYLVVDHYH